MEVGAWRTAMLFAGDEFQVGAVVGVSYLSVSGGVHGRALAEAIAAAIVRTACQ